MAGALRGRGRDWGEAFAALAAEGCPEELIDGLRAVLDGRVICDSENWCAAFLALLE